eukprot:SAG31_NODE_2874_length_4971_cov_9.677750_7_plen_81_part_00
MVACKNRKGLHAGFYTQEDIKDMIAYGTKRGIRVVRCIIAPASLDCASKSWPSWRHCARLFLVRRFQSLSEQALDNYVLD